MHDNLQTFHARWSEDRQEPQPLYQHLVGVAELAEGLARDARPDDVAFSVSARLAGLLHDLGKYRTEFQKYLDVGDRGRRSAETDHAVYGAAASGEWDALAVAYAIAGHHAGLHDSDGLQHMICGSKYRARDRYPKLLERADSATELAGQLGSMLGTAEDSTNGFVRLEFVDTDEADKRRFDVFVRMLFSILVDADRLDSERFEQQHRLRRPWTRTTKALDAARLLKLLDDERRRCAANRPDNELTRLRNNVFATCVASGEQQPQGFYSLTVPTGGAKTLSSMAFALTHAQRWELQRVIVVIPYLSIIEQNAGIYRKVLGADQVLEHHSAVEVAAPQRASAGDDTGDPPQVLDVERAMENWDVPIVVTTSVQFVETLFAAATGRVQERELHEARSNRRWPAWMPFGNSTRIRVSMPSTVIRISPLQGSRSTGSAEIAKSSANWAKGIRIEPVRNSSETRAEWLVGVIMAIPRRELIVRAAEYCRRRGRELVPDQVFGFGVHGSVFACRHHYELLGRNAVKVHERPESYCRERDVYLRLRQLQVEAVEGHAVPQLVDYDDELLAIEMSVVVRPFVLDFGGAYLDRPPDYDAETLEQWRIEKEEQFEENWPKAESILAELRRYHIYVAE